MIGDFERRGRMYKILLRQMVIFAFVKARCKQNKSVTLQILYDKFNKINRSDVVSLMHENILSNMFKREITGNGIIYTLTGRFRYAEFDDVNKYMNEELNKKKEEKKK